MNILLKTGSVIFFLSLFTSLQGQEFMLTDSIQTTISGITYNQLPIQSDTDFNFLFYSNKNKKQNFELITIKDRVINRMELKNPNLDGGGGWYKSAVMDNEKLLLLHVDGFIVIYQKNKKGNYVLEKTLYIDGRYYNTISLLDSENILLSNSYNSENEKKLYDNFALCVFNLRTKKVTYSKEMDLGKGILLSLSSVAFPIESKKNKIAVAHPTLPFIYIYNDSLNPIDTIYVQFQDAVSADSVIHTVFSDAYLELNKSKAKEIIQIINDEKINKLEMIEKVFWLSDDVLGYTVHLPLSRERMFVYYSISEKRELSKRIEPFTMGLNRPYNFISTPRILINNGKTIWHDFILKDDESDMYYKFCFYNM